MQNATVLLVDDEMDLLEVTKESIDDFFGKVIIAKSVNEALSQLKKEKVDIVVSDFRMPNEDGLSLRRKMQQDFPKIPFILLTGYAGEPTITQEVSKTSLVVLDKPIYPEVLVAKIQSMIE